MGFSSVDEIYSYVEGLDFERLGYQKTTEAIRQFISTMEEGYLKENLITETEALDFMINAGKVEPSLKMGEMEYPSLKAFSDTKFNYIVDRVEKVKNVILKARYSTILWSSYSKIKHDKYCKIAIDSYLEVIQNSKIDKIQANNNSYIFREIIEDCAFLSSEINYRNVEIKKIISEVLFQSDMASMSKCYLLEFMLNNGGFNKSDFKDVLPLCEKLIQQERSRRDFNWAVYIAQVAIRISNKLSENVKVWYNSMGYSYELEAESRLNDDTGMIPIFLIQNAMKSYGMSGNKEKIQDLGIKFQELKKQVKLRKISFPLEGAQVDYILKYEEMRLKQILQWSSEEIYDYLIAGKDLFPTYKSVSDISKSTGTSFMEWATINFDINKNARIDANGSSIENKIFLSYRHGFEMLSMRFLNRLFVEGFKAGKITYDSLINYITNNLWIGLELEESETDGEIYKYSWCELVSTSLKDFFIRFKNAIDSNSNDIDLVSCIDSLTLKFEGMLRDLCKAYKINTIVTKNNTSKEMLLEELLQLKELEKLFNEDDILFYKFFFTSKGYNLRNNIAHAFLRKRNYNVGQIYCLICAILKVGNFSIRRSEL